MMGFQMTSEDEDLKENNQPQTITSNMDDTERRIDMVLKFLKAVEEDDTKNMSDIENETPKIAKSQDIPTYDFDNVTGGEDMTIFNEVKSKIMSQQVELEDKSRTQTLLQNEIKRLRDQLKETESNSIKDLKSKLGLQRKEYEMVIKRHLTFIDKLLGEKEELTKKCGDLTDQIKNLEKVFRDKTAKMEESFKYEMKQQKEMWQSSEKIKRDKWIAEKSKLIKESTIKGLEPEIQAMLAQHKQQVRALEEKMRSDFGDEKEQILKTHEHQVEALKARIKTEREKATEEERDFIRSRYQKQYEQDAEEFQRSKKKMISDFEDEKREIARQNLEESERKEANWRKSVEELNQKIAQLKLDHTTQQEESKRRQVTEMRIMEDRWKLEKDEWQTHLMNKFQKEFMEKEKQLRLKVRDERDKEIELAIQRLEADNSVALEELDKRYRVKISDLNDQNSIELKNKQLEFEGLEARYEALNKTNSDLMFEKSSLNSDIDSLQTEIGTYKNRIEIQERELLQLRSDKQMMKEEIRIEFRDEMKMKDVAFESLHERYGSLKEQIVQERDKHTKSLESVKKSRDDALMSVENAVKERLAFKDDIIKKLKKQVEDSNLRIIHLEHVMEKQRQQIVKGE